MEIGKSAIALFILRKEISNNLIDFRLRDKGCYQYLFNRMNTSWEEFANNKVSFITFNYDRSLEHFLFTSLKDTYGRTDGECADQINKISIIHVHGKLGELPWQARDGIHYGALLEANKGNPGFVSTVAHSASIQIKVITEDQSTSEEFQTAFKLLANADHILFLGFGYNPRNMERLKILDVPRRYRSGMLKSPLLMRGTAKELEDSERNSVKNQWRIDLPDNSSDSLLFLRKYAELD